MHDCQIEPGEHSWFVIGHSTGPAAILYLQCAYCGIESRVHLIDEDWGDYLSELAEAGAQWVARYLRLPDPFADLQDRDQLVAHDEGDGMTVRLWKINEVADLVDGLELFDEGDEPNGDVPF